MTSAETTVALTGARLPDEARRLLSLAKSPVIATGYEYWVRARDRSGRNLPGGQHLDPAEMTPFSPHVTLIDVVCEGAYHRFRNRVNGTRVAEIFGRDGTGKFIEHTGHLDIFDDLYRRFSTVVDEKALVYGVSRAPARHLDFTEYEHLTLPVASDGHTVDMLFGVRCALARSEEAASYEFLVVPLIG